MEITLLDYADAGDNVVLFWTSTYIQSGDYSPLGNQDFDFAERRELLGLLGTVDAKGDWHWNGKGDPRDDQGNTIRKLHAYIDASRFATITAD